MLPSHVDLSYFLEIAQANNLTRAAERLGVSQPSLTLAMQRLETCIGTAVLIRTRQGVKLTKAGERLLVETRRLMTDWENLRQQTIETMNEVEGRFTLGCHVSVAHYSLPLFLPALLRQHPKLEIGLRHDLSRNILAKVLSLEIDLAIVVNPQPHLDLIMRPLAKDSVTLWRSKRLRNNDVLICDPSLMQSQHILNKLKRQGFTYRRVVESSNLEVVAGMAACGCGVAVLPKRVAEANRSGLVRVTGAPAFQDEITLTYRVENRNVRAVQALSEAIQAGFAV